MRLWHHALLSHLPKQWLQGQHRECCALRGRGWGKMHSTVDYVFCHPYSMLYFYHQKVIDVLISKHKVNVNLVWTFLPYRGKNIGSDYSDFVMNPPKGSVLSTYPEHNDEYLQECLENLRGKGIHISEEVLEDAGV